eukprot:jgi/Botrbrau1/9275/Bobra.0111s0003.1
MVEWPFTTIEPHPPPAIPLFPAFAVALGISTSVMLLKTDPFTHSFEGAWEIAKTAVTRSTTGPDNLLLFYRGFIFLYTGAIGLYELVLRGPSIYRFYTMWSWALLILYFAIAWYASLRARKLPQHGTIGNLGYIVVALFHVLVSAVMVVDSFTWLLLVPMLLKNPDPAVVAHTRKVFYSFVSYNTHGANALFVLGELLLNTIPFTPYLVGYVGLYTSIYGLWAFAYFKYTGTWIYPVGLTLPSDCWPSSSECLACVLSCLWFLTAIASLKFI